MKKRFDYDLSTLGGRLRYKRERKGYTQKQIADKVGISVSQYRKYESNESQMGTYVLADICKALKISSDYIVLGVNESGKN